jgi:hypothetical protein
VEADQLSGAECRQDRLRPGVQACHLPTLFGAERSVVQNDRVARALPSPRGEFRPELTAGHAPGQ